MESARDLARKSIIFISIAALFIIILLLLKEVVQILLLIFAGILLAIFLRGLARLVRKLINVSQTWALVIAMAGLIFLAAAVGFLLGPSVSSAFSDLEKEVPSALERLEKQIRTYSWGENLMNKVIVETRDYIDNPEFRKRLTGTFFSVLSVITGLLIILVIGLYTAFHPVEYSSGLKKLFPKNKRGRVDEVLSKLENALLWWMVGQFSSMALVGILSIIGLLLLGVELAIPLGLLAAIISFVPNLGPIVAIIPAAAMGFIDSPQKALYVVLLYIGIQMIESYVITPQIQKKAVSISPAVLISVQIMFGVILGIFGLILATPLMVVIIVLIQILYVKNTLGDNIEVLGEDSEI